MSPTRAYRTKDLFLTIFTRKRQESNTTSLSMLIIRTSRPSPHPDLLPMNFGQRHRFDLHVYSLDNKIRYYIKKKFFPDQIAPSSSHHPRLHGTHPPRQSQQHQATACTRKVSSGSRNCVPSVSQHRSRNQEDHSGEHSTTMPWPKKEDY